jgi:hypothetical protein
VRGAASDPLVGWGRGVCPLVPHEFDESVQEASKLVFDSLVCDAAGFVKDAFGRVTRSRPTDNSGQETPPDSWYIVSSNFKWLRRMS